MANQNAQASTPVTAQGAQPAAASNAEANQPSQNALEDVCVIEEKQAENTHILERPPLGETREVTLENGQNYIFGFDKSAATSFIEQDGDLTITFNCGGKLVLHNYNVASTGDDASTFAFSDIVPQGELSSLIKVVDTTKEEDETGNAARKSQKQASASSENVANIEPAAGDESTNAQKLALIEPAAGDAGGGAGGHGYGFNSNYNTTPVGPLNAVGPLGATALGYGANFRQPNPLVAEEQDDFPTAEGPAEEIVDETFLGPIVETGTIIFSFGNDGPGTLTPSGTFSSSGSKLGGTLSSNGVPVDVTPTADGYEGVAGGNTVFTLTIDPSTGEYTFTLLGTLDHADGNDDNDVIDLLFEVLLTDADGDTLTTNILVHVLDDVPTIDGDGTKTVDEDDLSPASVSGNLVEDFGSDGTGDIHPNGTSSASGDLAGGVLSSGGVAVVITPTANGYVGMAGATQVFNITINPGTGAYTFNLIKPLDHSPGGDTITLNFGAEIIDYDGDTDDAMIAIKVIDDVPRIDDGQPTIGNGLEVVDETNLGPITVNGALTVDFGADTPSLIAPNGTANATGSMTGGTLTSHGVPVIITQTADGYVGKAGAVTVFTFTINPNTGAYSFTLNEQLDHADGANPNDVISFQFGVTVTDSDGDSDSGFVLVNVLDDVPSLVGDGTKTVDEDDLSPASVSGNLVEDFGEDGQGDIHTTDTFSASGDLNGGVLTSGGHAVTVTSTANGYVGTANGAEVFNLTINPVTGAYTFNLIKPLDHSAGGSNIFLTFGAEIVDFDTDADQADIVIKVKDDVPQIDDHDPKIGNGLEVVDETNLGPIVRDGNITFDFGGDGAGSFGASGTSSSSIPLTSGGDPVTITASPTGYIGTANGVTIFSMTINGNGSYTFTQFGVLDHPVDGSTAADHDDIITLNFGVRVSDADGDSDTGNIIVRVHDDGPTAHDDFQQYEEDAGSATGNVITGLNGGPGAADDLSNDAYDSGAQNHVTQISFGGNTVNVPTVGTVSIDGDFGTLTIASDGSYTYTAFNSGGGSGGSKSFAGGPGVFPDMDESEALDASEQQALGIAPGDLDAGEGDVVGVSYVSEVAGYSNTLGGFTVSADGTLRAANIIIPNSDAASPGTSLDFIAGNDTNQIGFFVIADGYDVNGSYAGLDFSTGELNFVFDYGLPTERAAKITDDGSHVKLVYSNGGVDTLINGPIYYTTERGGADNLNADKSVRVVSDLADEGDNTVLRIGFEDLPALGDKDYNDMVFDVTIRQADCDCECGTDQFVYTLTDGDGDTSKATLTLECLPDDKPVVVKPAAEAVDETNLGPIVETGIVQANFFDDTPGTIKADGAFSSTGSKLGGDLTSNGHTIVVTSTDGGYVGKANGSDVFTLTINQATGAYTFTLLGVLDHADGANANDVITLNFGVKATDADGDLAATSIAVNVLDDAPMAKDDGNFTDGAVINGNVLDNDDKGSDGLGAVVSVTFNGTTTNIASGASVNINGAHGVLHIASNGDYTYTPNNGTSGTDQFSYKMDDYDNDTSSAKLAIKVDNDDTPIVVKPATEVVDETFLGPIVETGTVNANFFGDTPGTITTNGTFNSSGSKLGGNLTSHGVTVNVTSTDTGYVGKAGGNDVFTLTLNPATGAYTFTLLGVLDHANAGNPNDVITLNFGVKATDADGDIASTSITVDVVDDAPIANDDSNVGEGVRTGNVVTGVNGGAGAADDLSNDNSNVLTKIAFGGTEVNVPTSGQATIDGLYGQLKISANGSYTYTPFATAYAGGNTAFSLNPVQSNFNGVQNTFTKNGITVKSSNGADLTWFDEGDGAGIGIDPGNIFTNEKLEIDFNASDKVTITVADLGANNVTGGIDYIVHLANGTTVNGEFDISTVPHSDGVASFTLNSSSFGGVEITGVDVYTAANSALPKTSFTVQNVTISSHDCPPDQGRDVFTYTLKDHDGDTSSATLTVEGDQPVLVVGENVNDKSNSTTEHHIGCDHGEIVGNRAGDILVGDVGGAKQIDQNKDYNVVLILDVSGSMGSSSDPNSRISLLKAAVNHLIADFHDYNTGTIKVHIVPFGTIALPAETFTVTDDTGFADAQAFVTAMGNKGNEFTNYEAPMQSALSWLDGSLSNDPIPGAQTSTYFVSDGEPNHYINHANAVTAGSASLVMQEIHGSDGTDEVGQLQAYGEVIGVGIGVSAGTLARLDTIDTNGDALDVQDPNDLDSAFQNLNPLNQLTPVGGDVLEGGAGNDILYGDSVFTDILATAQGLGTAPGTGWEVFDRLEAGLGTDASWDRADTINYIRTHQTELAEESVGSSGQHRTGGNDTLKGGDGTDVIFGQEGRDFINGDAGNDVLYGGSGDDVFQFTNLGNGVDTVKDFHTGDVLDISGILQGYDPVTDAINDFVFKTEVGGNTIISVNADGVGGAAGATQIATLEGVIGLDIEQITHNGTAVV